MHFQGQRIGIITCVGILLWVIIGIYIYKSQLALPDDNKLMSLLSPEKQLESCKGLGQKLTSGFWKGINLRKEEIPQSIKDSASIIDIQSGSITVHDIKVHYIHAMPKQENTIPVLLLHGQSFSSETWRELGTVQLLSAMGYYPIAIDLPGFGNTPSASDIKKAHFIDDLILGLNIHYPVIVSPSMSGSYSLSFLTEFPGKLGGFIPVSPVHTSILNSVSCKDQEDDGFESTQDVDCNRIMYLLKSDSSTINCIKVPTLVIWGEKDRGENSAHLCLLPESQGAEIPEGRHSAYLSNPDLWHKLLYNFLNILNATKACS